MLVWSQLHPSTFKIVSEANPDMHRSTHVHRCTLFSLIGASTTLERPAPIMQLIWMPICVEHCHRLPETGEHATERMNNIEDATLKSVLDATKSAPEAVDFL